MGKLFLKTLYIDIGESILLSKSTYLIKSEQAFGLILMKLNFTFKLVTMSIECDIWCTYGMNIDICFCMKV